MVYDLGRDLIWVRLRVYGGFDYYLVKLNCCRNFMVVIEFNLISCEFDGRLMVGFVSIEVREYLFVVESISCIN